MFLRKVKSGTFCWFGFHATSVRPAGDPNACVNTMLLHDQGQKHIKARHSQQELPFVGEYVPLNFVRSFERKRQTF